VDVPQIAGLVTLLTLALTIYGVLDVVLTNKEDVRNLPKPLWIPIILAIPVFGALIWFVGGRPKQTPVVPGGRLPPPPDRGPVGPEDDPRFLRRLDERLRDDDGGGTDAPPDDGRPPAWATDRTHRTLRFACGRQTGPTAPCASLVGDRPDPPPPALRLWATDRTHRPLRFACGR
jgi:hypothetical protein